VLNSAERGVLTSNACMICVLQASRCTLTCLSWGSSWCSTVPEAACDPCHLRPRLMSACFCVVPASEPLHIDLF
jgi:hypothetical protein